MKEEKYWILLSKKITGEASEEELQFLLELTNSNPAWKTTMENLQELWNSRSTDSPSQQPQKQEDAYLAHINRLKNKVRDFKHPLQADYIQEEMDIELLRNNRRKQILATLIASIFIIGSIITYSLLRQSDKVESGNTETAINQINVGKGSRSKIQLPDGSQVWVNSGSKLVYGKSFKGKNREITLDGEAYFDVVKDPEHPFIVHTSGIDIKVLGTAFNVKAYETEPTIEATLVHGSIEVTKKEFQNGSKIMLRPHEKLIYYRYAEPDKRDQRANIPSSTVADASSITIKPLNKNISDTDIVETAWVYNKLVFEDERFEDLATRMEQWYNVKISIENEKLKNNRITGTFVNETVEEAFKELQFLIPFTYEIKDNNIRISNK